MFQTQKLSDEENYIHPKTNNIKRVCNIQIPKANSLRSDWNKVKELDEEINQDISKGHDGASCPHMMQLNALSIPYKFHYV